MVQQKELIIRNSAQQRAILDDAKAKVEDGRVKIEAIKIAANDIRTKIKAVNEDSENVRQKIQDINKSIKAGDKAQRADEISKKI